MKYFFCIYLFLGVLLAATSVRADAPLTLEAALSKSMGSSPEVAAMEARADAEHSAIRSQYWLESPKLTLMREKNMTLMQERDGPMSTWAVAQEIKFPTKYFLLGAAQKARARAADEQSSQRKLEVRRKVISGYYSLYALDRVLALLSAQRETLREIARIAESRYATGAAPQQDEMKAHVEQTQLEREFLMAEEERSSMQGMFNAVLGQEANEPIVFPKNDLPTPKLNISPDALPKLIQENARNLRQAEAMADEAHARKNLAYMNYLPDFALMYQKPFGANAPMNAYAVGVEISVPLWFFMKQSSEAGMASAQAAEADRNLDRTRLELSAELRSLVSKVQSSDKILKIYETGLIPQATSTLNSSRASYRAGRTNFVELLDSERSLYNVRIAYYRTLAQHVENLARLEEVVGTPLSTLPFGDRK